MGYNIKNRIKEEWNTNQTKWLAVFAGLLLILVCIPLLLLAHYNYPSGDDFCFGAGVYQSIRKGAGLWDTLVAGFQEWKQYYFGWQGTYSATFLHIFQLGGKFDGTYFLTTYFLLGILVLSSIIFYRRLFSQVFCCAKNETLFLSFFTISMELVFIPSLVESIYWFVGGAAYTFFYGIFLLLGAVILKIYEKKEGTLGLYVEAVLFLIILGGGNYVTGLLTAELLVLLILALWIHKKPVWKESLLLVIYIIAFSLNIFAPGTSVRQSAHTNLPILDSIIESVKVGMLFMKQWTHGYILLIMLILLPFLIHGICKTRYSYKYPILFTIISLGIWCSNVTPSIYVNGTWGGDRIVAIVYYQYYLWWILNLAYWTGWLLKRNGEKLQNKLESYLQDHFPGNRLKKCVIPYVVGICLLLGINLLVTGYMNGTNQVIALRSIRSGEAEQYRLEQQQRWEYLENTTEMDVELQAFTVYPSLLFRDDMQEDPSDWRNYSTAQFFGKESIKVL